MASLQESVRRPRTYGKKAAARPYMSLAFNRMSPPKPIHIRFDDRPSPEPTIRNDQIQLLLSLPENVKTDQLDAKNSEGGKDLSCCGTNLKSLETAFEGLAVADGIGNNSPSRQCLSVLKPRATNVPSRAPAGNSDLESHARSNGHARDFGSPLASPRKANKLDYIASKENEASPQRKDAEFMVAPTAQGSPAERQLRGRKQPQRSSRRKPPRNSTGIEHQTIYVKALLDLANDIQDRTEPGNFQAWADALDAVFKVEKIAEASYSEVYRLNITDRGGISKLSRGDESVLKLIPLKPQPGTGPKRLKTDHMSAVNDVASEAQTLMRMTVIPGFTNLRDIRVMRGRLPKQFVDAWWEYKQKGAESLFPDPCKANSYAKDQLWAIIEMQDAGMDLEKYPLRSAVDTWDIFWGVTMALAKGEELAKFEHRDLHLGNICVRSRRGHDHDSNGNGVNLAKSRHLGHSSLKVTIIDYTLSRVEMDNEVDETGDKGIAFFDLDKDHALFDGKGDYQYDIYRYMRSAHYCNNPVTPVPINQSTTVGVSWRNYRPITNVLWLQFILVALRGRLSATLSNPESQPSVSQADTGALHKTYEKRLAAVEALLSPAKLANGIQWSARTVVDYALKRRWICEDDIVGYEWDEESALGD